MFKKKKKKEVPILKQPHKSTQWMSVERIKRKTHRGFWRSLAEGTVSGYRRAQYVHHLSSHTCFCKEPCAKSRTDTKAHCCSHPLLQSWRKLPPQPRLSQRHTDNWTSACRREPSRGGVSSSSAFLLLTLCPYSLKAQFVLIVSDPPRAFCLVQV